MHAALQVEPPLQRDPLDGVVDEDPVALHALDDGARKERPRRCHEKRRDEQQAVLQIRHARGSVKGDEVRGALKVRTRGGGSQRNILGLAGLRQQRPAPLPRPAAAARPSASMPSNFTVFPQPCDEVDPDARAIPVSLCIEEVGLERHLFRRRTWAAGRG